jgi:5'-nucleotidase
MIKTILVDLDGIVADLHTPWVGWINEKFYQEHTQKFTIEDITQYMMESCVPPRIGKGIYGFLNRTNCYAELPPLAGALDALEWLQKAGYDLVICSAPARGPNTAADKLIWVKEHMPWLKRQSIFLGHRKEMIRADAIIDDSPDNLAKYKAAWPYAHLLTIDWPFNREAVVHVRGKSYKDTGYAWTQLVEYITLGRMA